MSDVTFRKYFPHTLNVDVDPETGAVQQVMLHITRLNVDQAKDFNQRWTRRMDPPSLRAMVRKPEGEEQTKVPTTRGTKTVEAFLVDDDDIRRRRLLEMTDEQRAAQLAQEAVDDADEYDFLVDTVRAYVRVAPGQRVLVESDDGGEAFEVRTGDDLVKAFGGHRPHLRALGMAVWCENNLTPHEKKVWRSLFDSRPSSSEPATAAAGPRPDAIAANAAPEASAATAAATALSAPIPSGSIAT